MSHDPATPSSTPSPAPTPEAISAPFPEVRLRHILVPVDFSPRSRKALDYGVGLARRFGARLTVLHVVELPYVSSGLGEIDLVPIETEMRGSATEQLAQVIKERVGAAIPVTELTRVGQPWFEVAAAAKELNVDLVIVGTHGYTGLKHVLLGSTAERVVRHCNCPVLVVRDQELEAAVAAGG